MHKALSKANVEYIKQAVTRGIPNATIAENLGITPRCVQIYAKKLSDETIAYGSLKVQPMTETNYQNTLARLREARDLLREQMLIADPRNIAQIVKEYRTTCDDIEKLEAKQRERDEEAANDEIGAAIAKLTAQASV